MSAITAKASRKMKKYAVLTREPRCFLGSFDFSWEQRKLSEITDKVTEKNAGLQYVETFTNSAEFGIISQRDFFDHDIAKLGSLDGYYIVKNEDFVYNPRISTSAPVGPINRNKLGRTGVMSPLYTVFRPHDIDTTYLEYFFKCGYWHSFMNFNGDSGARSDRFSIRDNVFFQMPIPIPDIDEQRKIGELLTCLDNLITLHQRKCANLCSPSQVVFSLLFATSTFSWEQRKLSEIATMHARIGWQNLRTSEFLDSGDYMLITGTDFIDGAVNFDTCHYVERERYEQDKHIQIRNGSILITKDGTLGKVAYIQGLTMPATLNAGVFNVEIKDENEVDNRYLFQYLKAPFLMDYVDKKATGGTIKHLNQNILVDFPVVLPHKAEQEKIGEYFLAIDHLITLHQRECISFTGRADRLILTANKKRTTSSWEQRKVTEIGKIYIGLVTTMTKHYTDEGTLLIRNSDIKDGKFEFGDNPIHLEKLFAEKNETRMHQIGDVITVHTGDVGTSAVITENEAKSIGFATIVTRPNPKIIDSNYLCSFLNTDKHKKWAVSISTGDGRTNYNLGDYFELVVPVPSIAEQKKIAAYIQNLNRLITLHQRKPFLMKWRTSDANRNQTNRLVL